MDFNRRDFLKVGFLSASAMTFTACGRPVEHGIVSQYQMPEYKILGVPSYWASTCTDLRADCGVSVRTIENRAVNVSGLPGHFFSKGTANSVAISSLTTLYHPARINKAVGVKEDSPAAEQVGKAMAKAGSDALIVVDRLFGSTGDAIVELAQKTGAKIWVCDSHQSMRERRILKAVTGRAELPLADLENRDYLVTVGSNLLQENYAPTRTGWAYGRFRKTPGRMRGKMVSFSARMNANDANADLWIPVSSGSEPAVLGAVGKLLADKGKGSFPAWAALTPEQAAERCGVAEAERGHFAENLVKLANRLAEAHAPLVVGGFQGQNGDATVYLAHHITKMLNGDVTTFEPDTLVGSSKSGASLFVEDSEVQSVLGSAKAVLVHNVDVIYRFPWLAESFKKVKTRVSLSTMPSETTAEATHVIPIRTWLEDWSDLLVESPSGTWYGLTQPAVRNQVDAAVSTLGFVLEMAKAAGLTLGNGEVSARKFLQRDLERSDFEAMQVRGGHWAQEPDPIYPNPCVYPPPTTPDAGSAPKGYNVFSDLKPLEVSSLGEAGQGMTFFVLPTHLGDGQLADRPWLQELPDAMTTVVWDSWIEIGDDFAKKMNIARHDIVKVTVDGKEIKGSAYPSPFIHPEAVGIPSGRGQKVPLLASVKNLGWEPEGSNPKTLLDGKPGAGGYFSSTATGAKVEKGEGSRLLATFDQRVYNLPRHILPE